MNGFDHRSHGTAAGTHKPGTASSAASRRRSPRRWPSARLVPAQDAGQHGGQGGAAGGQPSGSVPLGDDLLQSHAGRLDRAGCCRHPAGGEGARQAAVAGHELPGQRPGLPVVIGEHADPDRTALVVIYLILGMLYESTIHPITILSTLPSAGLGALLLLMAFGFDLSVIAIVGTILLIGIVKKNGIMLIDFALQAERQHGMTPEQAIYQACLLRFRPILMTTMAAMLGAVPLMLGTGAGSEIRQPIGYAIVGGLAVSQLLTLYTTGGLPLSRPFQPAVAAATGWRRRGGASGARASSRR